jgi:hypothetical protein
MAKHWLLDIGHMRKMSLAEAKARISELVDLAEHRGQRVIIPPRSGAA